MMDLDNTNSFINDSGVFNATTRNDSALYASQLLNVDQSTLFIEICQSIFADYHTNCLSEASFEQIVNGFKETATNGVQIFQRTFNKPRKNDPRIESVLKSLEAERNIFDLILKLFHAESIIQHKEENSSLLKQLFMGNAEFRRLATLLHWSEEAAFQNPIGFSQLVKEVEHINGTQHAFSHAAAQDKFAHLDSIYLEELSQEDTENLERIKRIFFCLLRCGRSTRLSELAEQTGLSSLKAYLKVRQLLTDPDLTPLDEMAKSYEFAVSRLHFKSTASLILSLPESPISDTDRCIWATLSGNLQTLLSFADNPDDVLWTYVNCAVETILDEETVTSHKLYINDIAPDINNRNIPATISTVFSSIANDCNEIYFKIIGYLAANDFQEVVNLIHADATVDESDVNNLRLYAHLVLLIKNGNYKYDKSKGDEIIFLYSKMLITLEMYTLVPYYLSKLEKEEADERMVDFLYEINGESMRLEILKAAAEVIFDAGKLCIKVYEKAKRENPLDDNRKLSDSIARRINIWRFLLIFPEETACNALIECNNLLRELFERDRYAEAMELLENSPKNLTVQTDEFIQKLPTDDRDEAMIRRIQDQQREFNSYLLYLEIMEKFSIWQHRINEEFSERPKKLSDVEYAKLDVIQRTEYERQMNQAMNKIQAHLKGCEKYQNVVVSQILDLLHQSPTFFASCLELNDVEDPEEHCVRVAQLSRIHERYLYYTITMLITLYRKSQNDHDVLNVANLLMDSRYDLYVHLSKESLRKLNAEISKSGYILALNNEEE